MSNLIQPVLVMDTSIGAVALKLNTARDGLSVSVARREAETEAAYIITTAPEEVVFFSATILMLDAVTADDGIEAWVAGLPVHSLDCECEAETPEVVAWLGTGMQCHPWHSEDCGV